MVYKPKNYIVLQKFALHLVAPLTHQSELLPISADAQDWLRRVLSPDKFTFMEVRDHCHCEYWRVAMQDKDLVWERGIDGTKRHAFDPCNTVITNGFPIESKRIQIDLNRQLDQRLQKKAPDQTQPCFVTVPPLEEGKIGFYGDPQNKIWDEQHQIWRGFVLYNDNAVTNPLNLANSHNVDGGTELMEIISKDRVFWQANGVKIHKGENGFNSIMTGDTVINVDSNGNKLLSGNDNAVLHYYSVDTNNGRDVALWVQKTRYAPIEYYGIVLSSPAELSNFRDPRCFIKNNTIYMAIAAPAALEGEEDQILFYSSVDGIVWTAGGAFKDFNHEVYPECPVLITDFAGSDWLFYGINGFPNGRSTGSRVIEGWFDTQRVTFTAKPGLTPTILDFGNDFYAPAVYKLPGKLDRLGIDVLASSWNYLAAMPNPHFRGGNVSFELAKCLQCNELKTVYTEEIKTAFWQKFESGKINFRGDFPNVNFGNPLPDTCLIEWNFGTRYDPNHVGFKTGDRVVIDDGSENAPYFQRTDTGWALYRTDTGSIPDFAIGDYNKVAEIPMQESEECSCIQILLDNGLLSFSPNGKGTMTDIYIPRHGSRKFTFRMKYEYDLDGNQLPRGDIWGNITIWSIKNTYAKSGGVTTDELLHYVRNEDSGGPMQVTTIPFSPDLPLRHPIRQINYDESLGLLAAPIYDHTGRTAIPVPTLLPQSPYIAYGRALVASTGETATTRQPAAFAWEIGTAPAAADDVSHDRIAVEEINNQENKIYLVTADELRRMHDRLLGADGQPSEIAPMLKDFVKTVAQDDPQNRRINQIMINAAGNMVAIGSNGQVIGEFEPKQ